MYCGQAYWITEGDGDRLRVRMVAEADGQEAAEWPEEWGDELKLADAGEPAAAPAPVPSAGRRTRRPLPTSEPEVRSRSRQGYGHYFIRSWGFPLVSGVKWPLLGWLVWVALLPWFVAYLWYHPLGLVAALFVIISTGGVLLFYEFNLIAVSALEAPQDVTMPRLDLADLSESTLRPFALLVTALVVSGLPWLACLTAMCFFEEPTWWPHVLSAAGVLSLFFLPINVLAVAMSDSPSGVNPRYAWPAVARLAWRYLLFFAFSVLLFGGAGWLTYLVLEREGSGYFVHLGILAADVYLLTVWARALGTFHYAYEEVIGWMRAPE
jgi:hypothetical protein